MYASGNASVDALNDVPGSSDSLSTSITPEPGSVALIDSGIVALAASRAASSLKRKLKR